MKLLQYDPGSVVYLDDQVQRVIRKLVGKAVRHGQDRMEAESAANFGFVQALATYDPGHGDFPVWVHVKVSNRMKDVARQRRYRRLPLVEDMNERAGDDAFGYQDESAGPGHGDLPDLTAELLAMGDDARTWVSLVLDPPDSVVETAARLGWPDSAPFPAAAFRQAVHQYLRDSDWDARRIGRAYREACVALCGKK